MEDHSAPKESQQQGQVAVRPAERKLDVLSVLLLVLQKLRTLLRGSRTSLAECSGESSKFRSQSSVQISWQHREGHLQSVRPAYTSVLAVEAPPTVHDAGAENRRQRGKHACLSSCGAIVADFSLAQASCPSCFHGLQ